MRLTTRTTRRILATTTVACAAVLAPAIALAMRAAPAVTSPAHPAHAAPATTPFCETPGLVIWLNTSGQGTLGSTFFHLEFTNLSGHSCTLNGIPFVNAVNLRGHEVGRHARLSGTPHQVTLRRGQTVTAQLQLVDAGNFPRSACHPVRAAGLRVFPPNQTRAKIVPFPFRACSRRGPVFLIVRPVRK